MIRSEKITITYQDQKLSVAVKKKLANDHLILFLHGVGCAKESFDHVFEIDKLDDYSLCTMDFVGFGESDKPRTFSYKLEDQAAVANLVLEQLPHKRVSVVAHSMGGAVGVLLARRLPRLVKFVNIEGNLLAEDCGLVSRNTAKQSLSDFEQYGYDEFLNMLTGSKRDDFREWAQWYRQAVPHAIHASAQSMVKWSDSGKLLDIFNALEDKVYIYGDEEPKNYLLPRLDKTDIRYIPNLKHFMMIENPDQFFKLVVEIFA